MKRQEKGRGKLDIRVLFTLAAIAEILGTLLIATLLTALLEDLGVAPETAAGVIAEIDGEDLTLRYRDLVLGAGTVSSEKLSPMECLPELMAAAREGWLLSESRETVGEEPCLRLTLDRTGEEGGKIVSTLYLREGDGVPVYGEIAVEGTVVLKAAFTDFTFGETCDTVKKNTD